MKRLKNYRKLGNLKKPLKCMKLMCLSLKKLAIKLFIKIFPILIDSVYYFQAFCERLFINMPHHTK